MALVVYQDDFRHKLIKILDLVQAMLHLEQQQKCQKI